MEKVNNNSKVIKEESYGKEEALSDDYDNIEDKFEGRKEVVVKSKSNA